FFAPAALAHCPLCVAGAGVGLSLARILGIDDSISGVWIAALLGAMAFWLDSAISRRKKIPFSTPLIYIATFATSLWSFYKFNLIIKHGDIFGIHKLTFGIIVGGVVLYLADLIDDLIIKKAGKVYFPYQRIIVSLGSMLILSIAVYVLINYYI
ncbi:MAG: hypothetical protein AAB875_01435, partial [Patescibacteria group bacterium]